MKRILIPAGGTVLATGLLAAGLAGTATAAPDHATDPMAANNAAAQSIVDFWTAGNNAALKKAEAFYPDLNKPKLTSGGAPTTDGKPGYVAPIGGEKTVTAKVKNINLPKSIGKVFFVTSKGELGWCSATSIQSKYRNLVSTAGHCVYDLEGNRDVMDKWVFVPGYYQGKAPWGIYVGKQAWTHYDLDVYEDLDKDYAFVTVYNGVHIGGGTPKAVSKDVYDKFVSGPKFVKTEEISQAEYQKCKDFNGKETADCYAKEEKSQELVGPNHPDAVLVKDEVTKEQYEAAPNGNVQGAKYYWVTENVTESQYKGYTGPGYRKIDAAGNFTITHFYLKKFVKKTTTTKYLRDTFYIVEGFVRDAGRLGDNVGGQGFAWNQKTGQPVYVFGYPAGPHPDGNHAFTGVTPKWCYGKTSAKSVVVAKYKVEEHIGLKCSMTGGASGAPWLLKYSSAKRMGYVNGVTSLAIDSDGNGRYDISTSPYFDGETADIYKKAANVWSGKIVG